MISKDEENQLWDSGVISIDSTRLLQNALFYYNRRTFAYREVRSADSLRFLRFKAADGYV